jgi:hypothetical protein
MNVTAIPVGRGTKGRDAEFDTKAKTTKTHEGDVPSVGTPP